jgi:hypothetical protein
MENSSNSNNNGTNPTPRDDGKLDSLLEPMDLGAFCLDFYGLTAEGGVPVKVHKLALGVVPIDGVANVADFATNMHSLVATTDLRGLRRLRAYLSERDSCQYRIVRLGVVLAGVLPDEQTPPRRPSPDDEGEAPQLPNEPVVWPNFRASRPRSRRIAPKR